MYQHIFTCRPNLILFTKKFVISLPVSKLIIEIFCPTSIPFARNSTFLNVSQLPKVQNLKLSTLVHCAKETATCAEAIDGNIRKQDTNSLNSKFLVLDIKHNPFKIIHLPIVARQRTMFYSVIPVWRRYKVKMGSQTERNRARK